MEPANPAQKNIVEYFNPFSRHYDTASVPGNASRNLDRGSLPSLRDTLRILLHSFLLSYHLFNAFFSKFIKFFPEFIRPL